MQEVQVTHVFDQGRLDEDATVRANHSASSLLRRAGNLLLDVFWGPDRLDRFPNEFGDQEQFLMRSKLEAQGRYYS